MKEKSENNFSSENIYQIKISLCRSFLRGFLYSNFLPEVSGRFCNPCYLDSGILGRDVDREFPKGSKWPADGPHFTWGSTRGIVHIQILLKADRIQSVWFPVPALYQAKRGV